MYIGIPAKRVFEGFVTLLLSLALRPLRPRIRFVCLRRVRRRVYVLPVVSFGGSAMFHEEKVPPNKSLERTHKDSTALAYATAAPPLWAAQLKR